MDAIILAAGKGTRMAPLCTQVPKPMLPVAGKPILEHLLARARGAGIRRVVIVVEHLAHVIEERLRVPEGMKAVFVRQGEPQGTGHAVAVASQHIDGDALLLMGDSLVSQATLKALVDAQGLVLAAARVADARQYGVLETDGDRVTRLHEKPADPPSDLANTGFYRVPAATLQASQELNPSPRGELEFTDLVQEATWIEAQGWIDVGNPWQYLGAHEAMMEDRIDHLMGSERAQGTVEAGVHVRGRLFVEPGALVKAGTYVEGDVLVRAGAVVGPNAYLRGPVEIGPDCKVGAASEIKNSILLQGARAPHHNYVGDSILGHGCNLGSGTKLANVKHSPHTIRVDWDGTLQDTGRHKFGAVVGDRAKTGVNVSLNPGTVLRPDAAVPAGASVLPPDNRSAPFVANG